MKKTWNPSRVEIFHSTVSLEEYEQLLDEWAAIVYRHLCQLTEDQAKVSRNSMPLAAERTGTNG